MNINEALNILGITGKADKSEIRKVYKKLAIKYHPDKNPAGTEMMKVINAAFEFLNSLEYEDFSHSEPEAAYNYGEQLAAVIEELKKLQGLIIEICGNWIWLSGDTKNHKDELKSLGCFWAAKKLKWYYRPAEHKTRRSRKEWDMDEIREKYGSNIQNARNYQQLTA